MRACTPSEATQRRVGGKQQRDLRLIGLELLEGAPNRRVLVGAGS